MKFRFVMIPLAAVLLAGLGGCKKKPSAGTTDTVAQAPGSSAGDVDDPNRIVVTAKTAVYTEADEKSTYLASVGAGETVTFLGDSVGGAVKKDPKKKEPFLKIKLSDGKEGWARTYGLLRGKPAVALSELTMHQRPDLFSPTVSKKMALGQLVALQGTQDDFVKISSSAWQTGWVRTADVSTDKAEIVAGILAATAMSNKTDTAALNAGLAAIGSSSASTAIYRNLKAKLDSIRGPGAEEAPASEAKDEPGQEPEDANEGE